MKKFLLSLFLLLSLAVTAAAAGTDIINYSFLSGGKTTDKTAYAPALTTGTATSGAQYYGKVLYKTSGSSKYIQFNCGKSGSDLVTIKSGGIAKSVKITWSTAETTSDGNKVNVYGQKTAYSSTSDSKGVGTLIATATKGSNASETLDLSSQPYEFIAINAPKATYIESIEIEWVAAEKDEVPVTSDDVEVTYNPASPKLDLSKNLPADLLSDAKANPKFSGADAYVKEDGTIIAATTEDLARVTVAWAETDKYKVGSHTFNVTINKAEAALAYSAETATATMGETATLPTLTNPYNLKLRYSSSKRAVADIDDNTGAVTIVAPGTATIAAYFDGNELFKAGSATYTLTVQDAGLPATPEFSFTDEGTYKIDQKLAITTATEDAEIYYSLDGDNYIKYEGEISFDKADAYTVFAYAKNAKGQSTTAKILFTIEKYSYDFDFSCATELELGTDRIFTPELAGLSEDLKKEVKYDVVYDNNVLEPMPGTSNSYLITGAGSIMVTATIAESTTHNVFSKELTVTVKEQPKGGNATLDFTSKDNFDDLKNESFSSSAINLTGRTINQANISLAFANPGSNQQPPRMWNNASEGIDLRIYNGHTITISSPENTVLESIEFIFHSNNSSGNKNKFIATSDGINEIGSLTTQTVSTDPRTWTTDETKTNTVIFAFNGTARIIKINVKYTAEPATAYDLKFDKEVYEFEVGDKLPAVNVPEGYTATYVFNGTKVDNPETFVFTEDLENAELYAYAFTGKDDKYLPAVAYAIAVVKPIVLPGHLTIHYSNADGFSMASFATENEGAENEYVFKDIEVTGYDSVDGHYYGHVFFSFYKPAEAAGAPRRAAEDDWSAVNNLVTYTPAEHLTMAQPGSSDALTLVRNKANTFTGMPNSFRVPSSHETGNAVNFTVKLTENGTPATITVASGTQTGVESVGVDADGEAEYYTLQGVRVAKPAAGIYLRRQGGTVSKVLVK